MKTAVFVDLDGTLWEWGKIPDSAREAIGKARENGHKVLVNSGRTRSGVPAMDDLFDGYCLGAGSEVVIDGQTVVDIKMGAERIFRLIELLDAHKMNYNLEGSKKSWFRINDRPTWEDFVAEFLGGEGDPLADFGEVTDPHAIDLADINKLFIHSGPVHYSVIASRMPEGIELTQAGGEKAELTVEGVTKASAIEAVRAHLGDGWRTMAIGDSDNDLPMLAVADISVAMGNGNENVKALATWTTADIWDDGLAKALAHFGLL